MKKSLKNEDDLKNKSDLKIKTNLKNENALLGSFDDALETPTHSAVRLRIIGIVQLEFKLNPKTGPDHHISHGGSTTNFY